MRLKGVHPSLIAGELTAGNKPAWLSQMRLRQASCRPMRLKQLGSGGLTRSMRICSGRWTT